MQRSTNSRRGRSLARRTAALATGVLAAALLSVSGVEPAGASAPHSLPITRSVTNHSATTPSTAHNPIGGTKSISMSGSTLSVTGWAADPDKPSVNITVAAVLDGHTTLTATPTSLPQPDAAARHHTGPTPGYALSVTVPDGVHTVCVAARNVGPGVTAVIRCIVTPLGTRLSTAELAAHNPQGAFKAARTHRRSLHVWGWSSDPDLINRRGTVVLYVDGSPSATFTTTRYRGTRPAGAGTSSFFDTSVPVSSGAHVACIWVVNVGLGHNAFLGCRAGDTRGKAGAGALTTPTLNTDVLAEAERHLGQPYVWAATGPTAFDCSGLVQYSYRKYGFTTPRVARDQFAAARLIPMSRALPGDMVFYSSSVGEIYHVGIVSGPGLSVAAIDPAEGVNWQRFGADGQTFFGSFTHT